MERKKINLIMDVAYSKGQTDKDVSTISAKMNALFKMKGTLNSLRTANGMPERIHITEMQGIHHEFLYREIESQHELLTHPDFGEYKDVEPFNREDFERAIQVAMESEDLWNMFDGTLNDIIKEQLDKKRESE